MLLTKIIVKTTLGRIFSVLICIFVFGVGSVFLVSAIYGEAFSVPGGTKIVDKNFHETACEQFFPIANCVQQLNARGSHYIWPKLNPIDNFYDLRRILLIVHYNFPNYESSAKVYALYRKVFANIIFCGPEDNTTAFWPHLQATRENKAAQWLSSSETKFVPYGSYKKASMANSYLCLPLALDSEPTNDYQGALVMSDDVVANYWNFKKTGKSLTKNWLLWKNGEDFPFDIDSTQFCKKNSSDNSVDCRPGVATWMWPSHNKRETRQFYDHLNLLANGSASLNDNFVNNRTAKQWNEYWRQMKANLVSVTGGERRLLGLTNGDCFYVAKRYFRDAVPFLRLLGSHHVFLEIAVVTALRTIAPLAETQSISVEAEDWGNGVIRSYPFIDAYKFSYEIVHPFKLGGLNSYFSIENKEQLLPMMMKKKQQDYDISSSCVYCNLLQFSQAYRDALDLNSHSFI